MITDYKEFYAPNNYQLKKLSNDEDTQEIIKSLYEDKMQLLNDKKQLYVQLQEKNNEILKIAKKYKAKWEKVNLYIQTVHGILDELNINDKRLDDLQVSSQEKLDFNSNDKCSMTSSSLLTDTADSNYSSSSDSVVANNGTIKNTSLAANSNEFVSTSSISAYNKGLEANALNPADNLCVERPHSHCLMVTDNSLSKHKLDAASSEPEFKVPGTPSPSIRNLFKRNSIPKREKTPKIEYIDINGRNIGDYTHKEVCNWLSNTVRLPQCLIENIKTKTNITGQTIVNLSVQKFDKTLGITDKLIRKKILLYLEASEVKLDDDSTTDNSNINESGNVNLLVNKDHLWVANVWLRRHLGLTHYSPVFLSRLIDGRLLHWLATGFSAVAKQKEAISLALTNFDKISGYSATPINNISAATTPGSLGGAHINSDIYKNCEPTKFEIRSIRFGLMLLEKFNFDVKELELRRQACENTNMDLLVWTNERLSKFIQQINLKQYTRGIEYSGLHGAMMVLDSQFNLSQMWKLLQVSSELIKRYSLDEKFASLLKPSRFNEGIKTRRSTTIFRRRSFSQPRMAKVTASKSLQSKTSPESAAKFRSQTMDISNHNRNKQNNFVRTYRKQETSYTHTKQSNPLLDIPNTDRDSSDYGHFKASDSSLNTSSINAPVVSSSNSRHYLKSPPPKVFTSHTIQFTKKKKPKSVSESDPDDL